MACACSWGRQGLQHLPAAALEEMEILGVGAGLRRGHRWLGSTRFWPSKVKRGKGKEGETAEARG